MPTYPMSCGDCGHAFDVSCRVAQVHDPKPCPACGCEKTAQDYGRKNLSAGLDYRWVSNQRGGGGFSRSEGFLKREVPQVRREMPEVADLIRDDGRVRYTSASDVKRYHRAVKRLRNQTADQDAKRSAREIKAPQPVAAGT